MKTTHGYATRGNPHSLYKRWCGMKDRCCNKASKHYKRYGARGIAVSARWMVFENFLNDMGPSWKPHLSLDRIDNDGDYEPSNCRWATLSQQAQNRRSSIIFTINGVTKNCSEWARATGVKYGLLLERVSRRGWSGEQAINGLKYQSPFPRKPKRGSPVYIYGGQRVTLAECARRIGMRRGTLQRRVREGMKFEDAIKP